MNMEAPKDQDKFRRYRANKKARGLREIRLWVRDPNTPEFKDEMKRAAAELGKSKAEHEAMDFIWATMDDTMKDEPY